MIKDQNLTFIKHIGLFLGVVAVYSLLGWSGLELASINNNTSPIWAPSGFAIGSLLIFGPWLSPAVFLGAILTNMTAGTPVLGLLGIATGNMLEAIVGSQIILWLLRRKDQQNNYSEFFAIVTGSAIAAFISATIGTCTLYILDITADKDFAYNWYTWWSGDSVGALLVLPLILEAHFQIKNPSRINFRRFAESTVLLAFMVTVTIFVFTKHLNEAYSWVLTPFFIIAGLRLGQLLSRILLLLVSLVIVYLTLKGYTPFEFGDLNFNFFYIQSLLASYAIATLFVRPFSTGLRISKRFLLGCILGWTCIFLIIYAMALSERKNIMSDLHKSVEVAIQSMDETTHKYELLLAGGNALFKVNSQINSSEWEDYVNSLHLEDYYQGFSGLGFVAEVKKDKYQTYLKDIQTKGVKYLYLKTFDDKYSENFSNRFVVTYAEPMAKIYSVIGLDLGSEQRRREAAEEAQKMNRITSSEPIQLIFDEHKQKGFLVYYPVRTNDGKFLGFIYAPVITKNFFSKVLSNYVTDFNINVAVSSGTVVYQGAVNRPKEIHRKEFLIKKKVSIFNQTYNLEFYPTYEFFLVHSGQTGVIALILSLFMLFISAYLLEQITFGENAEKLMKKKNEELEHNKIQLLNSSKMAALGRMASGVAHEINNPLAIILMKIKVISVMLKEMKIDDSRITDEIKKIEMTILRIDNIIKGLKSFSRVSQDDPFEVTLLKTIVQESIDLSQARLNRLQITLKTSEIPEIFILTRPSQLSQVLLNLLNNSIDAVEGNLEKWISLDISVTNSKILIAITDSGPGIPKDISPRIMDPFYTTKEVGKGTGLGLSIAKDIVEDHGGTLWLDKNCAHTRFVLELPRHRMSGAL